MKAAELREAYKTLKKVSVKKLPVSVTIAVAFNLRKIEKIVREFEEAEMDLIKKYAILDDTGNPAVKDGLITIKPDMVSECGEASRMIMDREYGVVLDKIGIDDIKKAFDDRYDGLTAEEVYGLSFMTE